MKRLLQAYQGVGRTVAKNNAPYTGPFILEGASPPVWQTPGRLQYYKAENEPFLPGKSSHSHSPNCRRGQVGNPTAIGTSHETNLI